MSYHRQHAQFIHAKWQQPLLVALWLPQIVLALTLLGLFASVLARLTDDPTASPSPLTMVWAVGHLVLAGVVGSSIAWEMLRTLHETLTPWMMLLGQSGKFVLVTVMVAFNSILFVRESKEDNQQSTDPAAEVDVNVKRMAMISLSLTLALTLVIAACSLYALRKHHHATLTDEYLYTNNAKAFGFYGSEEDLEHRYSSSPSDSPDSAPPSYKGDKVSFLQRNTSFLSRRESHRYSSASPSEEGKESNREPYRVSREVNYSLDKDPSATTTLASASSSSPSLESPSPSSSSSSVSSVTLTGSISPTSAATATATSTSKRVSLTYNHRRDTQFDEYIAAQSLSMPDSLLPLSPKRDPRRLPCQPNSSSSPSPANLVSICPPQASAQRTTTTSTPRSVASSHTSPKNPLTIATKSAASFPPPNTVSSTSSPTISPIAPSITSSVSIYEQNASLPPSPSSTATTPPLSQPLPRPESYTPYSHPTSPTPPVRSSSSTGSSPPTSPSSPTSYFRMSTTPMSTSHPTDQRSSTIRPPLTGRSSVSQRRMTHLHSVPEVDDDSDDDATRNPLITQNTRNSQ